MKLESVLEKRRLDQALNAKEFSVLVGLSYSAAREWFRSPGFPLVKGVVFWSDFVRWRRLQSGLATGDEPRRGASTSEGVVPPTRQGVGFSPRARRILAEAT
ncbi:MAG: hypothetical protein H7A46_21255 [Verrucomicrobiales bacterium]|nr:hypothetical protein [Verrucomicrobiales bacterium]